MVLYGNASGPVTEFNPPTLDQRLPYFDTPTLFDYTADRASLEWRSGDVFDWIAKGELNCGLNTFTHCLTRKKPTGISKQGRYPLKNNTYP